MRQNRSDQSGVWPVTKEYGHGTDWPLVCGMVLAMLCLVTMLWWMTQK